MPLPEDKTVREIAVEIPGATQVFEMHQIDYYCGANAPLSSICYTLGLNPTEVLTEVETAARITDHNGIPDWNTAPLRLLIAHILEEHHDYLLIELPLIEEMLARLSGTDTSGLIPRLRVTFASLKSGLENHMRKEEMFLFPAIGDMEAAAETGRPQPLMRFDTVRTPIRVMEAEHESMDSALRKLRELTSDYLPPDDAGSTCRSLFGELEELAAHLHEHMHLENNILFPRAAALEASAGSGRL